MIRSVEFIAEALANGDECPQLMKCRNTTGDGCFECWHEVLKGAIKNYEAKILQSIEDTAEEGKV